METDNIVGNIILKDEDYTTEEKNNSNLIFEKENDIEGKVIQFKKPAIINDTQNTTRDIQNGVGLIFPQKSKFFEQKEKAKKKVLSIINNSVIEWGEKSLIDEYVIKYRRNEEILEEIIKILNEIFIENINNEDIVVKIFSAFSNLTYKETFPYAQTMCIAAFSINNIAINEAAVGLFESWRNEMALNLLKKMDNINVKWLRDYIDEVIEELEEELNVDAKIC